MGLLVNSEFADEYEDWLAGRPRYKHARWMDLPLGELACGAPLCVPKAMSIGEVVRLMNERHRGAVLVMHDGGLVGIFTERDVLRRVVPGGIDLGSTPVFDVMTSRPETLPEWSTLAQGLREMVLGGYRHIPILDDHGVPVAVVSMRTIIEYISDTFPSEVLNAPPEQQGLGLGRYGG